MMKSDDMVSFVKSI